jgi:hypothetical protein
MVRGSTRFACRLAALAFLAAFGTACDQLFGIKEGSQATADGGLDGSVPPGDAASALPDSTTLDSTVVADASDAEPGCADPQLTRCGAACVNLTSDDGHCGACGRDCQDAGCASGVCLPVTLATLLGGASDLAIDSTNVYWTDGLGNVTGMPIAGGARFRLAAGQTNVSGGFAADGTNVYWANQGTYDPDAGWYDGSVMRVAVDGGSPVPVAVGQSDPESIAVDGTHVFWANKGTGEVMVAAVGSGAPTTLAKGLSSPAWIATDGTYVYCADHGDGTVQKVPIDNEAGAPGAALVFGYINVSGVAVAGGSVYWVVQGPPQVVGGYTQGSIMQVPADGGVFATLALPVNNPFGIAADSTHVYWTEIGAVMSAPVDGGAPSVIASGGQQYPGRVAVDSTNVYWTDPVAGTVMKRVK